MAVGYKGTSPPKLYVTYTLEAIQNVGLKSTEDTDPLDLKNTLVSFSYFIGGDGDTSLTMELTLMNPSVDIESKLFSWYSVIYPNTVAANATGKSEEESLEFAREHANLYVRFGYVSPDANSQSIGEEDIALSHIHKVQLYDMTYNISDKKDRIVTLRLAAPHALDMSIAVEMSEEGNERNILVECEEEGVPKDYHFILSEAIVKLLTNEKCFVVVDLSNDQKEAINDYFKEVLDPARPQIQALLTDPTVQTQRERIEPLEKVPDYLIPIFLRRKYAALELNYKTDTAAPAITNVSGGSKPSLNQVPGVAAEQHPVKVGGWVNNQFSNSAKSTVIGELEFSSDVIQETIVIGDPVNPTSYFTAPLGPFTLATSGGKTSLTLSDLIAIRNSNRFSAQVVQSDGTRRLANSTTRVLSLTVEFTKTFKVSDDPALVEWIDIIIDTYSSRAQRSWQLPATQGDVLTSQQEDSEFVELAQSSPKKKLEETGQPGNYVQFTADNPYKYADKFIEKINTKIMQSKTEESITSRVFNTVSIDVNARPNIDKRVGAPIDWEKDYLYFVGPNSYIKDIARLAGMKKFKSFDIQPENDYNVVSVSTGFNDRQDCIVTDLKWRLNQGSIFMDVLTSPQLNQQLYNVAKRFEGSEYRDVVDDILGLQVKIDFPDLTDSTTDNTMVVQRGIGISPAVRKRNKLLSSRAFAVESVKFALNQASKLVSFEDKYPNTVGAPDVIDWPRWSQRHRQKIPVNPQYLKLIDQVAKDFAWINSMGFMETFFPSVVSSDIDYYIIDGQKKSTPAIKFVSVAPSPLSVLQGQMGVENDEEAILMSAKLRSLNTFRHRIFDIYIETLGIPEMDIPANELESRDFVLWVAEPRVPGTFHWLTGVFNIKEVTHTIDRNGYRTKFRLMNSKKNTIDEIIKKNILLP